MANSKYTADTKKTIENMRNRLTDDEKKYFDGQINAGGGIDKQRLRLIGPGKEFYMTSGRNKEASGNFLTKEHPGKTAHERKENLQLPPGNDGSRLNKVRSKRPVIAFESTIAPQKDWAKKGGYKPREGMRQIFTPNRNQKRPIEAGVYEIESQK